MSSHSRVGGSGAKRWINCPASVALSKGLPEEETSVYAQEGTDAHELAEKHLREMIESKKLNLSGNEAVDVYTEYVRQLGCVETLEVEKEICISYLDEELWGTVDAVAYNSKEDVLHVIDFKFGQGVMVDAKNNYQLLFYATGVYHDYLPERIKVHIVQPRANSGDTIKTWEFDAECIVEFEASIRGALDEINRLEDSDAELDENAVSEGSWCQFCPALSVCPKHIARYDSLVPKKELPVTEISDEFIVRVISEKKSLLKWIESLEKDMAKRLLDGEKIEGLKVVESVTKRRFKDFDKFQKKFGKTKTQKKVPITLTEAKKAFGEDALAPYLEKPAGKPTMVPADDKRKPIEVSITEGYDSIEGDEA